MDSIFDDIFCIKCGSMNVESIKDRKYLCSNCKSVFSIENFRMAYKIANKKMLLETGEMNIEDIVESSMDYIFKSGIILGPNIEEEIRMHIGEVPEEMILTRLSYLECTTEDLINSN